MQNPMGKGNGVNMLNDKIREYVRKGGNYCPYCGSNQLQASSLSMPDDDIFAYSTVECLSCHKVWEDLYKLTSIEEKVTTDEAT